MQQPAEKQVKQPGSDAEGGGGGARPKSNWKDEHYWMKKWGLIFRACILLVSFLSFVLSIATGDFHRITEISYLLGVACITMLYMVVQVGIKGHEFRTKTDVMPPKVAVWIDFSGDQFLAYMLFSAASVGAAASTSLRNNYLIDAGLELAAAATSMSFFAFLLLAPVTLISGYRLVTILSSNS